LKPDSCDDVEVVLEIGNCWQSNEAGRIGAEIPNQSIDHERRTLKQLLNS
jgi:hypothetical protein